MVATIRHNFTEAVVTYEEKPREQWIFDPPAQVNKMLVYTAANDKINFFSLLLNRLIWGCLIMFWLCIKVALAGTQIWWTTEVNIAFSRMEEGFETALKDYFKKQVSQLNTLINLLLGELTKSDRQRIMTICTIDVHARDVVQKMITQKVENSQAFTWLSQLRHRLVKPFYCHVLGTMFLHIYSKAYDSYR